LVHKPESPRAHFAMFLKHSQPVVIMYGSSTSAATGWTSANPTYLLLLHTNLFRLLAGLVQSGKARVSLPSATSPSPNNQPATSLLQHEPLESIVLWADTLPLGVSQLSCLIYTTRCTIAVMKLCH
jgi:hypothetical protein